MADEAGLSDAIRPLLDAVGAVAVAPDDPVADLVLEWDGRPAVGVRLPDLHNALERLIDGVERELGGPLGELDREDKQIAVRLLEERGAFTLRRSAEKVAEALGVSRFTVYNYLNADRPEGAR